MSQENVDAVRTLHDQFARGDFSALADTADDFEFVTSPEMPDAGTYRGDAARRWMTAWVESFEDLTMEATEIIDAGDRVVFGIVQRGRPRGSQTEMEGLWWQVMTFRAGEITRTQLFGERSEALAAVGLSE